MIEKIVKVPVAEKESFIKEIEKLNLKAVKYNCQPIQYEIGEVELEYAEGCEVEDDGSPLPEVRVSFSRNVYPITIKYEEIKIGNYVFIAQIEHLTAFDSSVTSINGYEDDIASKFQNVADTRCDHCHTEHHRRFQIILKNVDTNEYVVVGKSCVKDYTGLEPKDYFRWFFEIERLSQRDYSGGFETTFKLEDVFKKAVEVIEIDGFKSMKNSARFEETTAFKTQKMLCTGSF